MTGLGLDQGWLASLDFTYLFKATMPSAVHEFVNQYLTSVQPPIFDSALLLLLLVVSSANVAIGVLFRNYGMEEGRAITFVSMEVLLIVFFLVVGIFILFAQAVSEGN
jgi:hypothetical protein